MPFPLFHALAYKLHTKSNNIVYSMLPDFFGLINISIWDKMHNKHRLKRYIEKYGNNEIIKAMAHHLEIDDFLDGNVHTDNGILSDIRKEVDKKLINNFNISGNFLKDVSEFVMEMSLDQITYKKYDMKKMYNEALMKIKYEYVANLLKRYLKVSRNRIKKYLIELKQIEAEDFTSVDRFLKIARKRYGFSLRGFLELAKKVKSTNLGNALKNANVIRKFAVDRLYREKLKEIMDEAREKIEDKFDILIDALNNANPYSN